MADLVLHTETNTGIANDLLLLLKEDALFSNAEAAILTEKISLPETGLILLLMSPSLLEWADTQKGEAVLEATKAWFDGETRHLILIIAEHCDWEEAGWLGLQVIPASEVPLDSWKNKNEAFEKAVTDLKALIDRNSEIRVNPNYFEDRVKKMKAEGGPSAIKIASTLVWKSIPKGVKWGVGAILAGLAALAAYQIF